MPVELGPRAWLTFAVVVVFLLAMNLGLTVKLFRRVGLLHPASPRLQKIVDETADAMGVHVEATWEVVSSDSNAMAYVMTNELGFSRKLLAIATDEELKAICAHELGHLTESRWVKAVRVIDAYKFVPLVFSRPAWELHRGSGVAVLFFLGMLIWALAAKLGQVMERRADKIARSTMEEPVIYARVLEKMHRAALIPAVLNQGTMKTHPDLYDRMQSAGLTPDYSRPLPPYGADILGILTYAVMGYLFWILAERNSFF